MALRLSDRLILSLDRIIARRPAQDVSMPLEPHAEGRTVWFRCPDSGSALALGGLLRRMEEELPDIRPLVTIASGEPLDGIEPRMRPGPSEEPQALKRFLDHWRPEVAVLIGSPMLPVTVAALRRRGVPTIGAGLRLVDSHWMERRWLRPLARRHFGAFAQIMTEDQATLAALRLRGAAGDRSSVGGALAAELAVPPANDAERDSLSDLVSTRPVWCAAGLPMAEVKSVATAHGIALARSHRLLLVVVPDSAADGMTMRDVFAAEGLVCGLRSEGEDPLDDMSVYVADLPNELGLWLRLAPVTFVGGTMTQASPSRTPMEAAALGSAILHGPETTGHAADHARLDAVGAARLVRTPEELATAVDMLIAPDQAAAMAHAAWEVSSAPGEAAERLLDALRSELGKAR